MCELEELVYCVTRLRFFLFIARYFFTVTIRAATGWLMFGIIWGFLRFREPKRTDDLIDAEYAGDETFYVFLDLHFIT
jgi:hypothetical protein